jgi:hypothetical protein
MNYCEVSIFLAVVRIAEFTTAVHLLELYMECKYTSVSLRKST